MAKISDCSYMEIKKIYSWSIVTSGKKAICAIVLTDITKYNNPKKITVSLSNLYNLMELFKIDNMYQLIGKEARCLIHDKFKEITFISPLEFKEKKVESDFVRCNQVYMNEP